MSAKGDHPSMEARAGSGYHGSARRITLAGGVRAVLAKHPHPRLPWHRDDPRSPSFSSVWGKLRHRCAAPDGASGTSNLMPLDSMDSASKTFDERLYALFEQLRNAAGRSQPPRKKVAIISTPRCGSKFFCESLASTGRSGYPAEWMNPSYVNAYARVLKPTNLKLSEYVNFIIGRTTSPDAGLLAQLPC